MKLMSKTYRYKTCIFQNKNLKRDWHYLQSTASTPWLVIPVTSSSKYQDCVNFASTMRPSCGQCPPCCPQTVCGYVHCAGVMHLLCVCAHKRILGFNIISLLGFAICVFTTNYEYVNMLFLFQSRRKTQVVRRQDVIITRQIENYEFHDLWR